MPFFPAVLGLLRLLSTRPGGVSQQAAVLELGAVLPSGRRGDLVVPLALKMERLARHINRRETQRDQAMALVKMLFRGP